MSAAPKALTDGSWRPMRGTLRWVESVSDAELRELHITLRPQPPKTGTFNPNLIACPDCHAKVTQTCRTSGGNPTANHDSRLVSRRCACGDVLAPRKTYCEPCRQKARKATYRAREIRRPSATRRSAA